MTANTAANLLTPLGVFVATMAQLVETHRQNEPTLLASTSQALSVLLNAGDWLSSTFKTPAAESYRQYILYSDPLNRFSVVSFVWDVGQFTPIHDHMVWGAVGVLEGKELAESYVLHDGVPVKAGERLMCEGDIELLSPSAGDIHRVSNARSDGPSISIHVYGADIGSVSRHVFAADGTTKEFISGYSNNVLPHLRYSA